MCPDCRLVFRVPRDHDGQGLVCQSCRRLLRIPATGEATAPLLAEITKTAPGFAPPQMSTTAAISSTPAGSESALPRQKHRLRKRRSDSTAMAAPDRPSWERETLGRSKSARYDRRSMRWMLAGGVALIGLVAGGLWIGLRGAGFGGKAASGPVPAPQVMPVAHAAADTGEAELPAIMKRSMPSILAETEPLARKFLEAKTIDELLPLLRKPERAKPRLQREFPQGRIDPPGLAQFNITGSPTFGDSFTIIAIRTRNFESRQLTFVQTPEGLKIDWESWAGWSEMSWSALLAALPTEATVFRVIVKRVDYYNFGFSDETQWQSYRLESLDGEHMIFGYVQRGSPDEAKIHLSSEVDQAPMILKIRFPARVAASNNQVVVDDVIATGWLEKDD